MNTRRQFLSRAALASAALAALPLAACAQERPETARAKPTGAIADHVPLGGVLLSRAIPSTGEMLPSIGVGTSGSYEVPLDSAEFAALKDVVKVFFEGGGSVIDTSPNYSNAEDVVGALLADGGWRERCFLATKLAADSRAALEQQWADSLRRLRTDKVQLLQVHNLRNLAEALPYARELKAQGKTKYIGLTHFRDSAHAELAELMRKEKPDFVQINYSVSAPAAAKTVFPVARELGIAVIVNRAFDDGKLFARSKDMPLPGWAAEIGATSWAQLFLRFAISDEAVTVVIPATGKPERQADNLKGGIGPMLSASQNAELVALFA
ncbi:aldo/keto reductase [Thermomonas carbonis]|uniref:Aldo/keto reductase n=1 Tax=Thermomonas carbonis TaxID=1463158 RepID=A0A7G9SMC7_9GAMM|nr:aldo/keto reductase [Thermomonas carbonis]QNN69002.1 aldo/keto reductase [Thermomonas carbonis]GHC07399.1 aldo/keto reductase [Thermomonas carbonis]